MKEEWKIIEDYPTYMISNFGRVKNLGNGKTWNKKERLLKQAINKDGYCVVKLSNEGKQKEYRVHRLVATAFIENTENKPEIDHIDGNKQNNCVNNLRWVTSKENRNNPITKEKHIQKMIGKKRTQETKNKIGKAHRKPIACYNKNGDLVALYTSIKQASELLNINHPHISDVCNGKRKSCGGYIFKYIKKVS